jgi:hypothetical protein
MLLKIKTPEIELEYSDELSIIDENAKKRILEIINQLYEHRVNDVFDSIKK